jgi:hypothetical protein
LFNAASRSSGLIRRTRADVKNFLLKIFHALAAGLITGRRAGILCYIAHAILQAQRGAAHFQKLADEKPLPKQKYDDNDVDPLGIGRELPQFSLRPISIFLGETKIAPRENAKSRTVKAAHSTEARVQRHASLTAYGGG